MCCGVRKLHLVFFSLFPFCLFLSQPVWFGSLAASSICVQYYVVTARIKSSPELPFEEHLVFSCLPSWDHSIRLSFTFSSTQHLIPDATQQDHDVFCNMLIFPLQHSLGSSQPWATTRKSESYASFLQRSLGQSIYQRKKIKFNPVGTLPIASTYAFSLDHDVQLSPKFYLILLYYAQYLPTYYVLLLYLDLAHYLLSTRLVGTWEVVRNLGKEGT